MLMLVCRDAVLGTSTSRVRIFLPSMFKLEGSDDAVRGFPHGVGEV